jgi:pyruvate dehydrogenase E1 component alpha subunit
MLGANGVVGDGAPIAVGAGLSIRLRGENRIAVAFIGDGAVNRGPFMEALNWAQVYELPVLFVCEDNAYASSTRTSRVTGGTVTERARSFGMLAETVDGNDIFAVDRLSGDLVQRVRAGHGPALVHAKTYRWYGHTTRDDGSEYRDAEEVARFRAMDPIARCEGWLKDQGVDASELEAVRAAAAELIEKTVTEADAAPWPATASAYHDIQDIGAPAWPK